MNKARPVLLRNTEKGIEILAFEHPLAGNQLVKGSIKRNETLEFACKRELTEESGLIGKADRCLGIWHSNYQNQIWGFCLMSVVTTPQEN